MDLSLILKRKETNLFGAFTGERCKREVLDAEPWWLKLDIMMFISVDSDCKSRHC